MQHVIWPIKKKKINLLNINLNVCKQAINLKKTGQFDGKLDLSQIVKTFLRMFYSESNSRIKQSIQNIQQ